MAIGVGTIVSQAKSALAAAQVGMNTTAKNVSNVNTEGYSRQRVEFSEGLPENYGHLRVGGGVDVSSVTRSGNQFVDKRIEEESTSLGKAEGIADIYDQLEMVFKDDGTSGMTQIVSQFFNDLRTLSTQPDALPLRAAVRESAKGITTRFQTISQSVGQVVDDLNRRVEGSVLQINTLVDKIGTLNGQIMDIEVQGKNVAANDERDQRDMAVRDLAKLIDISVTPMEHGTIMVSSGRMGPIVMGVDTVKLGAYRSDEGAHPSNTRVFMLGSRPDTPPKDVTDFIHEGQLGGFLNIRDQTVPGIMNKVDHLAYNLANEVNNVHRDAFGRNGKTGMDFFEQPEGLKGAAGKLTLSGAVMGDLSNIAAAQSPNSAGDNRAILKLTDLQQAPIFEGGKANFSDLASSVIGTLGVEVKNAHDKLEIQKGLVDQLDTVKTGLTGVSLDEEAMNMLKFQKQFDASAKLIQLSDQMMDTVINLKRF